MLTNRSQLPGEAPWLAPMAGYTDLPFRLLCRECGCGFACTEMISAKGVVYDSKSTWKYLGTYKEDTPLVVQIFGSEPYYLSKTVEILSERGFRYFDLNAGCSVKKVVKTGSGAALLKDPPKLGYCLQEMQKVTGAGKVGVKIRSGWSVSGQNYLEVASRARENGADWVTLHPRSAKKGLAGSADWNQIQRLQECLDIPVLASGDLLSAPMGVRCLHQTDADNFMFARGALKDPLIFSKFLDLKYDSNKNKNVICIGDSVEQSNPCGRSGLNYSQTETVREKIRLIKRHMELACRYQDEKRAFLKMRTVIPCYLNSFYLVGGVRKQVVESRSWQELLEIVDRLEQRSRPVQEDPDWIFPEREIGGE